MKYLDILQENESSFYNSVTYIFLINKKKKENRKKKEKKAVPWIKRLKRSNN